MSQKEKIMATLHYVRKKKKKKDELKMSFRNWDSFLRGTIRLLVKEKKMHLS